jgi:nuclear pore complex protein Nup98-Nup96
MFNTTKPATGFGAFGGGGGTSAFGSGGGAFGSTTPSQPAPSNTSLFAQPGATGSAFGTSTFGSKPATSAFGATSCMSPGNIPVLDILTDCFPIANPNTGPYDGVPPVTTGTANPAYSVFSEKDSANANVTLQYQSITCMPQYRGNSFEVSI